jgi:uncharacterized protein
MLNVLCKIRRFFVVKLLVLLCLSLIIAATDQAYANNSQVENPTKKVAIVIDDFGNDMSGTEEMMALNIPFTAAVMPFLPTTKRDAEWAHRMGRSVVVHLPMEPLNGKQSWLGPGAIMTNLSDAEIRTRVLAAIDNVPYAVGVSNHMGSKATADQRVMQAVLEACRERGMFFLDSRTNYKSVVTKLAEQIGVKTISNQLFIDESYTMKHISGQLIRLKKQMQHHASCVAIGHVGIQGKKTAEALKLAIPELEKEFKFVTIVEMISANEKNGSFPL